MTKTNVYWFRNDLRVHDNPCLQLALKNSADLQLIWCPDRSYLRADQYRRNFIQQSIADLSITLGKKIAVRDVGIQQSLIQISQDFEIQQVYSSKHISPEEKQDEQSVQELSHRIGFEYVTVFQDLMLDIRQLPFEIQKMPDVFTVFRKKIECDKNIFPESYEESDVVSVSDQNLAIEKPSDQFCGGEKQALARLKYYIWQGQHIRDYKQTRNGMIRFDDSSKFSPWINSGCLSVRKIYSEIKKYELQFGANDSTYWLFFELLWRDYFKLLSIKYGNKIYLQKGLKSEYQNRLLKKTALDRFDLWTQAQTGHEFIDACMNELNQTGWLSNRGRQNVASFLCHHLDVPWTWGAQYFEKKLIDYDPDLNWGNWLYLSGYGTDPRQRVFNPDKQAEDYDIDKSYRKKWSPHAG